MAIQCLFEDSRGDLWVGTDMELGRFDGLTWTVYRVDDGLPVTPSGGHAQPASSITAVAEGVDGVIWCGTMGGAAKLVGERWVPVPAGVDGPSSDFIYCIVAGREGNLLFGTNGGFSMLKDDHWFHGTVVPRYPTSPPPDVLSIMVNPEDGYYFGTSREWAWGNPPYTAVTGPDNDTRRLSNYFNTSKVGALAGYRRPAWSRVDSLQNDTGRGYPFARYTTWMGTGDKRASGEGIVIFDGTELRPLIPKTGPRPFPGVDRFGAINAMHQDARGDMWIAHQGSAAADGLAKFDGNVLIPIDMPLTASPARVLAILEDRRGYLWFGLEGNNLHRYDGSGWLAFPRPAGSTSQGNLINSIDALPGGIVWTAMDTGVTRFNGASFDTLLKGLHCSDLFADEDSSLWVSVNQAAGGLIVLRKNYRGEFYADYTGANLGFPSGTVASTVTRDRAGIYWFGTLNSGIARYDGVHPATFVRSNETHAGDTINCSIRDPDGALWFGTTDGLARLDDNGWTAIRFGADGAMANVVLSILADSTGEIWAGTYEGVAHRTRNGTWDGLGTRDGRPTEPVRDILRDRKGHVWFATDNGAVRYDGERWTRLTLADGLLDDKVTALGEDERGRLWFGGPAGISVEQPDRVAPRTVLRRAPPGVSGSRTVSAEASIDLAEEGLTYSWSLDDASWGAWAASIVWPGSNQPLVDGVHVLRARARDSNGNIDPFPAAATFEVDATPPAPRISAPNEHEALKGRVVIVGTTTDARFRDYALEVRRVGDAAWRSLGGGAVALEGGELGAWSTESGPDGDYDIRLSVADTLGLTGSTLRRVTVDNVFPYIAQTSPAVVSAATGGTVYTTDGRYTLTVPAHTFSIDVTVRLDTLETAALPETLSGGFRRTGGGVSVGWGPETTTRPVVLRAPLRWKSNANGGPAPLFFWRDAAGEWRRLGGTPESEAGTLALPSRVAGTFGLYLPPAFGEGGGSAGILDLAISPRAASAADLGAGRPLLISFTLRAAAQVSVRLYDRRGVLIRRIAEERSLTAGANVLTWDGRDESGAVVADDLYFVAVEADGHVAQLPIAVTRSGR